MKMFNEKSECFQICSVLYEERLNPDFENILNNSGYGFILSPLHTPDNKDKKPHRHIIIKDMHGHALCYDKINTLLETLNKDHCSPAVLTGGLNGLKAYARYMIHQTPESLCKEQFDLKNPDFSDVEIDENGCVNGLLSVYAPFKGVCFGGGLDFFSLTHKTIRELADDKRAMLENARETLLTYIYSNCCINFADFVKYASTVGLVSAVVAENAFYYRIIKDMFTSSHYQNTEKTNLENKEVKKEIEQYYNTIQNCYSYVVSILMVAGVTFTDNLVHTFIDEIYHNDMDELLIANDIEVIRDFNKFIGRDIN